MKKNHTDPSENPKISYQKIKNTHQSNFSKIMGDKKEVEWLVETPTSLLVDGAATNPSEATPATNPWFDTHLNQDNPNDQEKHGQHEAKKLDDLKEEWFDARINQDDPNDQEPRNTSNLKSSEKVKNNEDRKLDALNDKINSLYENVFPNNLPEVIISSLRTVYFKLTSQNETFRKIDRITNYVNEMRDTLEKQQLLIDNQKSEITILKTHLALSNKNNCDLDNELKKYKTKSQIGLKDHDVVLQKQKNHVLQDQTLLNQTTLLTPSKQLTKLDGKLHQDSSAIKNHLDEKTKPIKMDETDDQQHTINLDSPNTVNNQTNLLTDEEKLNNQRSSKALDSELTCLENSKKKLEDSQSFLTHAQNLQEQTNEFRNNLNQMSLLVLKYTEKIFLEKIENEAENKYLEQTTEEIDTIWSNAETFEDQIKHMRRNHGNTMHLHIKNELLNGMEKLENIESQNNEEIRKHRRAAMVYVKRLQDELEKKLKYAQ